jgi:hypothetical protein
MRSQQQNTPRRDFPAIYESPTIETLEDGSLISSRRDYARIDAVSTPINSTPDTTTARHSALQYTPRKTPTRAMLSPPLSSRNVASRSRHRSRRRAPHHDFQIDEDALHVSVKTVDIAARTVFEPILPVSLEEWHRTAQRAEMQKKVSMRKRLSPSLQHLELLHRFQSIKTIRQLNFSPSLGMNADALCKSAPRSNNKRDGRYRSIDPLQATREVLPDTPPLLSNRKLRLPMRCDVGFPNTTPEEIQTKQNEIRLETQWEEASPRLIVLITSDNLGQAVVDDDLPLAGKELLLAKKRNAQHFQSNELPFDVLPNRNSVLAPPLGATHSSTLGWRPRPFYDRPPGMLYTLASPLSVNLNVGDVEPLVCTLTLYSLGKTCTGQVYGKLSEDYSFPAGDWENKVNFDAARRENGELDPGMLHAWRRRKHKALFSYDPLLLSGGDSSLHLVLQVYRVSTQQGSSDSSTMPHAEDTEKSNQTPRKKSIGRRIKKSLGKLGGAKGTTGEGSTTTETDAAQISAEDVFEKFGTQLLTPLCFGVTPFCPNHVYTGESDGMQNDKMKWPSGSRQLMHLYAFPAVPEDQDRFLERITTVADEERLNMSRSVPEAVSYHKQISEETLASVDDAEPLRKGLFNKMRSSSRSMSLLKAGEKEAPLHITGRASLFTSFLGTDFTQSMLTDPAAFGYEEANKEGSLPRLLVDVSGDCAIAVNPVSGEATPDGRKRSDLIRLPKTLIPSGYLGASEVREMMFLPPRFEKQYDVDPPISFRSIQNILLIYPRFLKFSGKDASKRRQKSEAKPHYAIRVRLVRLGGLKEDGELEPLTSFYNPAPWAGPPILDDAFTKVVSLSNDKSAATKNGVVFRDEMKMRLPMIVDGSFHLQFSLVEVDMDDGDLGVQIVAETNVPLSSSSTREASSGVRVTTIIPNGSHRLKLGDCQLQFETRLISSVHVADPTTATALRDFPLNLDIDEKHRSLALVPSRSVVGRSISAGPIVDLKIPFYQLFATASDSNLFGSFHLFVFVHLCNLVNHDREGIYVSTFLSGDETKDDGSKFLMDNLQSLFELLRKVKLSMVSRSNAETAVDRIEYFVKDIIDTFDENAFTASYKNENVAFGERFIDGSRAPTKIRLQRSRSEQSAVGKGSSSQGDSADDEIENQVTDGGAVHMRAKDSVRAEIDLRLSRTVSKISFSGSPLARVAYGATKTDRWRAEAEHYQAGARFSHFVDDDETVITAFHAGKDSKGPPANVPSKTWEGIDQDDASVVDKFAVDRDETEAPEPTSFADSNIAKRVRLAAQIIIAPCIAPSASASNGMNSPSHSTLNLSKIGLTEEFRKRKTVFTQEFNSGPVKGTVVLLGSDDEYDSGDVQPKGGTRGGNEENAVFRGEASSILLPFSYGHLNTSELQSRVFAYEPIMALWVKAWIHHTSRNSANNESNFPPLTLWQQDSSSPIYGFYAHMDVLLPLCLKSMILRCSAMLPQSPSRSRVIFDTSHMEIMFPFVGVLASSLLGEANSADEKEEALSMALESTDTVVDFLVGLAAVLHPQQLAELIQKFFKVLRDAETPDTTGTQEVEFRWEPDSLHSVRCSRQLRLRVVERFSVIGPYLAMNFPGKFTEWTPGSKQHRRTWTTQSQGTATNQVPDDSSSKPEGTDLLPKSGWLADLLVNESLLICSLSCEVFVTEAIAHIETSQYSAGSPLQDRPGKSLTKQDLLLFQSIGLHAITCVHELLIRRHAMDSRFQTEQCRSRIASLVVRSVLEKSTSSVRWLARMESTHKIRSLWLVCFSYILQEAPETILRSTFRDYCGPKGGFAIHRIIRLLRLSSSTFQCLVDETTSGENSLDSTLLPWLLQESFNSICASIILIIDECTSVITEHPRELKKMAQGTVDLLLQILTVPQSAVTHLRTVGGALQALDKFGVKIFLGVTGDNLQHWIRVILTLMNSISLSVRSIAVDFAISLLGESFARRGTIEDIALVFATVLPEVVAREIGLYSVAGLIKNASHVEQVVWPLRRALGDIEDANPLDDDRVDPQLSPILSVFCRSCQAIIDGVMVELKLRHGKLSIVGTKIVVEDNVSLAFDADEESLFEAANYFTSEGSPMQRLRWLNTLKLLHESKGQWVEAAETLMLCARTVSDSLPHLRNVWMPSEFVLWNDTKRSLWLGTIGQDQGFPDRGNLQVMEFASGFLQPSILFGEEATRTSSGKVAQPSVHAMCNKLMATSKESISLFIKEEGNEELAFSRLESLLRVVMVVVEEHSSLSNNSYQLHLTARKRLAAEAAALRKASASLNSDMTKLAEKLLLVTEKETRKPQPAKALLNGAKEQVLRNQCYVRVRLSGVKPKRFLESTSIPTYFEWDNPCICRVPQTLVKAALAVGSRMSDSISLADKICNEFGKPLMNALAHEDASIMFRVGYEVEDPREKQDSLTYLDISVVHVDIAGVDAPLGTTQPEALESKRFLYRKSSGTVATGFSSRLVELTVARPFPCALSRQRTLITSEFEEGSA